MNEYGTPKEDDVAAVGIEESNEKHEPPLDSPTVTQTDTTTGGNDDHASFNEVQGDGGLMVKIEKGDEIRQIMTQEESRVKKRLRDRVLRVVLFILEITLLFGLTACLNVLWWLLSGCASRWCFATFHVFTIILLEGLLMLCLALFYKCRRRGIQCEERAEDDSKAHQEDQEAPREEGKLQSNLLASCGENINGIDEAHEEGNNKDKTIAEAEWMESQASSKMKRKLQDVIAHMKHLRPNTCQWVAVVLLAFIGSQILVAFWLPTAVLESGMGASTSCDG